MDSISKTPSFQEIFENEFEFLKLEHQVYYNQRQMILQAMEVKPGQKIIDLGCGSGTWSEWFKELSSTKGEVMAVDISTEMIAKAISNHKNKQRNIMYTVADVKELPFVDSYFDLSFAGALLMYLREPNKAIHEMKRITKLGGKIALSCDEDLSTWSIYPIDIDLWRNFLTATKMALDRKAEKDSNFRFDQYFVRQYYFLFRSAVIKNIKIYSFPFLFYGRANDKLVSWIKCNIRAGLNLIKGQNLMKKREEKYIERLFFHETESIFGKHEIYWQKCEYLIIGEV